MVDRAITYSRIGERDRSASISRIVEGKQLVLDLIPRVDVMIQNFAHGVIERLGFGFEVVSQLNLRLIVCNVSAFGRTGPLKNRPGYDPIAQAYGGILHMLGYEGQAARARRDFPGRRADGRPLLRRHRGRALSPRANRPRPRGQRVAARRLRHDAQGELAIVVGLGRRRTQPPRQRSPGGWRSRCLRRWRRRLLVVAAVNDQQWRSTCEVMGRPDLASDERFATSGGRRDNRDDVNLEISHWLSTQSDRDAVVVQPDASRPQRC